MNKINPSTPHPEYEELEERYDVCDDAFEGEVCDYVPHLTGQTEDEWKAYVNRAAYYNVVDKTVSALVGSLTRKPYVLTGNEQFPSNEYGTGNNFIQACYRDLLLGARVGILVDVNEDGASHLTSYDADDIINWRGDGTKFGDFVVIEEEIEMPDPENPFALVCKEAWRELYIDEDGYYAVRLWTKDGKDRYKYEDLPPMLVNGQRLSYIPLWVANPFDNTWDVYSPPLYTQSKLNIQLFKKDCEIAHLEHFMAIPTFTIIGDLYTYTDQDGNQITSPVLMGSTKQALHLTQGSQAQFTEVQGGGHNTLMISRDKILEAIYASGSRLLTVKKGVESADALQIRSGSESAILSTIVGALEGALNPALALCAEIDRQPETMIELNMDFTAAQTDPAIVKSLLDLYAAGTITLDQLLNELYAGEVVKPIDNQPQ